MKEQKSFGGLDYFKAAAAVLVTAIHTSPLASVNVTADFILTRVAARVAVPFFLMTTGYFLLPELLLKKNKDYSRLKGYVIKVLLLYLAATLLYLPVSIYAGHFKGSSIVSILKMILTDGTFYHLWYLPAAVTGILLLVLLNRILPFKGMLAVCLLLYTVGLFGDSYYGLLSRLTIADSFYDGIFRFSSYTRNGLFYAPVFLLMGAGIKTRGIQSAGRKQKAYSFLRVYAAAGAFTTLLLMMCEALILRYFKLQRHDSMYISLLPCMYFLFTLLLSFRLQGSKRVRSISTWFYIIHPMVIIIIRGAAGILKAEKLLVENSMVHFLSVCMLSFIISVIAERFISPFLGCYRLKEKVNKKDSMLKDRAWIELDRENLSSNVNTLKSLVPKECRLMPALKADAYGHGAVLMAKELLRLGINIFCVASLREGIELRQKGIRVDILILGYTQPDELYLLNRYHLIQTVIDYSYALKLNCRGKCIRVHLKLDTGMHRLGERYENLRNIERIFELKNLKIEGIYSHLCASDQLDEAGREMTCLQEKALKRTAEELEKRGYHVPAVHLLGSYGIIHYPDFAKDYVRPGIALYGMLSTKEDEKDCPVTLKPVLSLKARVAEVKALHTGEAAGYGMAYTAERESRIAILSIGYADGIPRSLSCSRGKVLINGYTAYVAGRICMDQMMADVTDIPDVKAGDTAVLIGRNGDQEITACDLAEEAGTIANEILSRLGKRLTRVMV